LEIAEPIYESIPGWKASTERAKKFDDLPAAARDYVHRIAELTGARLKIVSVGPARAQTIFL
jgi:adenylosuccinate synthase